MPLGVSPPAPHRDTISRFSQRYIVRPRPAIQRSAASTGSVGSRSSSASREKSPSHLARRSRSPPLAARMEPWAGCAGFRTVVRRKMRSRIARRGRKPVRFDQSSAKAVACPLGPMTPGSSSPWRCSASTGSAPGSSTSEKTRFQGGVITTTSTTVGPRLTVARSGGITNASGAVRRFEQIPKIRLCSASRAARNEPAVARNASTPV